VNAGDFEVAADSGESTRVMLTQEQDRSFFFGPFHFVSEIEIPELRGASGRGTLPVSIVLGPVQKNLPDSTAIDSFCHVAQQAFLLDVPEVARFLVQNGQTVTIDLYPEATIANVTTYLLASIFGALCHQNGLLPLHASAVVVDGAVTAFLGDSGAGKSTLAAFLKRRGYPIVSDDICLLESAQDEGFNVIPVAGWLKLWRQSIEQIGDKPIDANRIYSKEDKFRVFLRESGVSSARSEQLRLRNIVFLERPSEEDSQQETLLETLSAGAAMGRLMNTIYQVYLMEAIGQYPRLFQHCAQILNRTQAFRLVTPRVWHRMDEALDLLETQLLKRADPGDYS